MKLPAFPICGFELPKPPTASVSSIKYLDTSGVEQTWSSSEYSVTGLASEGRARIEPAYGYTWPANRIEREAVRVLFVAGYGAAAAVPEGVKDALLAHVAEAFQNRERPDFSAAADMIAPWIALRFDE